MLSDKGAIRVQAIDSYQKLVERVEWGYDELVLKLPEDLAFYRNYLGDPMTGAQNVGTTTVPKVK